MAYPSRSCLLAVWLALAPGPAWLSAEESIETTAPPVPATPARLGLYQREGVLWNDPDQARFGMRADMTPATPAVQALEASERVADAHADATLTFWRDRSRASMQVAAADGFGDNVRFDSELILHLTVHFPTDHPARAGVRPLFLDAGSGIGFNTRKLVALGAKVVAVDQSAEQLALLRAFLSDEERPAVYLNDGDLLDKSFEANSFDGILSSHVLHYLSPRAIQSLLHQFHAWLKPTGRLYIQAFNSHFQPFHWFQEEYQANKRNGKPWPGFMRGAHARVRERASEDEYQEFVTAFGDTLHGVELEDLLKLLRACDFTVEEGRETHFLGGEGLQDELMVVARPTHKVLRIPDLD